MVVDEDHESAMRGAHLIAPLHARGRRGASAELSTEHVGELSQRAGDAAGGHRAVEKRGVLSVWQQVEAGPIVGSFGGVGRREGEIVGHVHRGELRDERADRLHAVLAVTDDGAWLVQTPHIPMKANGSGDVTAALFTAHYRATGDAADALARTTSSVYDLLQRTYASGERELQLVESQEAYAHPRMQFEVRQVR